MFVPDDARDARTEFGSIGVEPVVAAIAAAVGEANVAGLTNLLRFEDDEIWWGCTPADALEARAKSDSIVEGVVVAAAAAAYDSFDEVFEASLEGETSRRAWLGSCELF